MKRKNLVITRHLEADVARGLNPACKNLVNICPDLVYRQPFYRLRLQYGPDKMHTFTCVGADGDPE